MKSPTIAPQYALYRVVDVVDPAGILTNEGEGINMGHYETAHIQVVPIDQQGSVEGAGLGSSDPDVDVLWWNDLLGRWVANNAAITRTGLGASTPYEFTVACGGRKMLVRVTSALTALQAVAIYVAGYDLDHTL